jgi:GPH family glycoside/pentoside/hexuronide:cation symporter
MSEAVAATVTDVRAERLKFGQISFVSFGDVVDGTISFGVGAFVFYYLTAVIGLPGTIVGGLLAFSITCDAVLDPLIGSISDTTRSRFGRRLPFMFIAGFPAALAFALLYAIPESLSGGALVFYVGAMLVLLRLSMSFFYLPYVAASAELSDIYSERSKIALYRSFFGCAANVVLLVLGYWVFMRGREGLLDREAYAAFGVTIALIGITAALVSAFATYGIRARLKTPVLMPGRRMALMFGGLAEVARNPSFWFLFLCCLLFWVAGGLAGTLTLHANLYFWRLPENIIGFFPILSIAGYLAGLPFCSMLLQRFEKRNVALIGLALVSCTQLLPVTLRLNGLLPDGEPTYIVLASFIFLGGAAGCCAFVPWGSMMADAADEHELLFGTRREALYFASLLLAVKSAVGLGGLLAGFALDFIRFPRDVASITGPLPQDVVDTLGLIQGPVAAAIGVVAALLLLGYKIDRTALMRIQSALAAKTAASSP